MVAIVTVATAAFVVGPKPERASAAPPASIAETARIAETDAQTIEVLDPVHGRPFDVSTWPASGTDRQTLVVISHGFAGDRTSHEGLASSLAANGYTVAAPTHPDLAGLEAKDRQLDPLVLRPRHLSLTIDRLTSDAPEPFDRVVVIGHSLGGYSALRLAAANPSTEGLDQHCDDHPTDGVLCSPATRARIGQLVADGDDFADPRVDAVVLLAPGYAPLFSPADLEQVETEALVISASSDDLLPGGQVAALVDAMPNRTESAQVHGGHYVFLRTCTPAEQRDMPALCVDDESVDRTATHIDIMSTIEEFLDR